MQKTRATLTIALTAVVATGCWNDPTSSVAPLDRVPADAKGDVVVRSEIFSDAVTPRSVQSDGQGAYVNGSAGVVSVLQGGGDWLLDLTGRRATRKITVSLTDSLPGNPSAAPFTTATLPARLIAKAGDVGGRFSSMVGLGSTMLTPLSIGQMPYGGKTYAIRMNTNNHPATDWAIATCIGVTSSNACNKWRLTPTGVHDGVSKNVGRLEEVVGTSHIFLGYYYVTFDIVVTQ